MAAQEQSLSAAQRSLRARIAAHDRWSGEKDRSAATAPARTAFEARFPNENARKAFFLRLAKASADARRKRRAS
jgi:hypothetical protein